MKLRRFLMLLLVGPVTVGSLLAAGPQTQKPTVQIPKPGVPEILTIEGEFIRAAYNNEGYVILGYRVANESVGEEWLMLEVGATMRQGKPAYKLLRSAMSLETPDGKKIPMATNEEFLQVNMTALQNRSKIMHDSIDYFPSHVNQGARLGFFSDLGTRTRAYDQVELNSLRATTGQIFFRVPGGIKRGQHWLNVQFKDSLVRVPFRVLTDDEEKMLSKNYPDIRKQVQEAFAPKKK